MTQELIKRMLKNTIKLTDKEFKYVCSKLNNKNHVITKISNGYLNYYNNCRRLTNIEETLQDTRDELFSLKYRHKTS